MPKAIIASSRGPVELIAHRGELTLSLNGERIDVSDDVLGCEAYWGNDYPEEALIPGTFRAQDMFESGWQSIVDDFTKHIDLLAECIPPRTG